ncbi:MAG: VWA domain-containing protein [Bryobacterales bacterium]|nr:VWA domain-containing protein [Bryobacterales bacterium]
MNKSLSVVALGLAALGIWKPQPLAAASTPGGMLSRIGPDGQVDAPCPLEHTAVTAEVQGPVVRVKVRQIFRNPTANPLEAIYTFPLAATGAVDDMTLRIGDRLVKGAIKRKEEARAIYDAARRHGKLAGLLDQSRPNVFVQSVANIPPNAKVEVEIQYVETLKFEAGKYEFVFPMVVGPRYSPKHNPGAFQNPKYAAQGTRAGHDISLSLKLDAGLPIDSVDSTTHEVLVENRTAAGAFIKLRNQNEIPNKDFILRWDVTGRKVNDALLTHRGRDGQGYFTFVLAPPDQPAREDITPKELVFVIDTSGSMHGFPLDKAKEAMNAALETLNPRDTFNLISFSGDTHILFPAPVSASYENIALAKQFLAGRRSGGGTEMMKAIRAALAPSGSRTHVRVVCFITDGYVGNDAEIVSEIRKHPEARVFTFGVGSSVNRHLLDQMSLQGRGEVEYVGLQDDGSAAARRFHARVQAPLLTDIQLHFQGLAVDEIYPKRIPDLFSAKPVVISGRYRDAGRGSVKITGKMGGQPFERTVSIELAAAVQREGIRSLWARTKVGELMIEDQAANREAITELGLRYALMTPFTSFVAVEHQTISEAGKLRTVEVPVEVPEGVDGRMAGAEMKNYAVTASAPAGAFGGAAYRSKVATDQVALAPPPSRLPEKEERDVLSGRPSAQPKLTPELMAKTNSAEKVGVRLFLLDVSPATLNKLRAAGLHIIAQPGGAKLIVGEIIGTKLMALAALQEVRLIAPR